MYCVCVQPKKSYICAVEEGQKRKSNKRGAPVFDHQRVPEHQRRCDSHGIYKQIYSVRCSRASCPRS